MYICKKCGVINDNSSLNMCQKCGGKLLETKDNFESPSEFISYLISKNGIDVLLNSEEFIICLEYLNDKFANEKRLMKLLATSGVLSILCNASQKTDIEKEISLNKAMEQLQNRNFLSRRAASEAVEWVTSSLGWNIRQSSYVSVRQPNITVEEAFELVKAGKYEESIEAVIYYAQQGVPELQTYAGYAYQHGYGVKKDSRIAYDWCLKAANQGEPCAQYMVGVFLAAGEVVEKNFVQARQWLKKSSDQGNADAKELLRKVRLGFEEAFDLFKRGNYVESLPSLESYAEDLGSFKKGEMYYYCGLGFDQLKDYESAFRNFTKAAHYGNEPAEAQVGVYYLLGNGVKADNAKAMQYLTSAASKGNKLAVDIIRSIKADK